MRHRTKRGWRQQRTREHLSGHCLTNSASKTQSRLSSRPTTPCIHRFRLACIRHPSAQPLLEPVMAVYCKLSHLRRGRWASTLALPYHSSLGRVELIEPPKPGELPSSAASTSWQSFASGLGQLALASPVGRGWCHRRYNLSPVSNCHILGWRPDTPLRPALLNTAPG